MMRYAQFREFDVANGPGIRCSLFVSGCTHNCPGCFNQLYQDFHYGEPWNDTIEEQLIEQYFSSHIDGLSILGGEPMQNTAGLIPILHRIRKLEHECTIQLASERRWPKSIWLYTGYTWEEIFNSPERLELARFCDVIVDGLFIEAEKDLNLAFRGSHNQRLIDVSRTLETGHMTEFVL